MKQQTSISVPRQTAQMLDFYALYIAMHVHNRPDLATMTSKSALITRWTKLALTQEAEHDEQFRTMLAARFPELVAEMNWVEDKQEAQADSLNTEDAST